VFEHLFSHSSFIETAPKADGRPEEFVFDEEEEDIIEL